MAEWRPSAYINISSRGKHEGVPVESRFFYPAQRGSNAVVSRLSEAKESHLSFTAMAGKAVENLWKGLVVPQSGISLDFKIKVLKMRSSRD